MNRSELFSAVWAEPMPAVAGKLGLSDRTLRLACKEAGIPTPGRAHWSRVRAGRAVVKPVLAGEPNATVYLRRRDAIVMNVAAAEQDVVRPETLVAEGPTGLVDELAGGDERVDWMHLEAACDRWARDSRMVDFPLHLRASAKQMSPEQASRIDAKIAVALKELRERSVERIAMSILRGLI